MVLVSFPLILYVYLVSSFLPFAVPLCLPSFLPFVFLFFSFILSLSSVFLFYLYFASGVLSFKVHTHSGSSSIESATHCTEPAFFQPWFEETDDKYRKRQWKRWLRQSLMFCHAILLWFCAMRVLSCCKSYRGSNGRSSYSVSSWKLWQPTNKHYEFFWDQYFPNSFLSRFQRL